MYSRHCLRVVGDHHRASAEHIAWPHQHRVADAFADRKRLFHAGGRAAGRLRNIEFFEQLSESLAIFRQVDRLGRCADDRHARCKQALRQVQRSLPAKLHNHSDLRARLRLMVVDREHVLQHQRLEVESIAGVVVRRNRLGIAIHHDGFVAIVFQRKRGMAAAVVKLDSLPDAIRTEPRMMIFGLSVGGASSSSS